MQRASSKGEQEHKFWSTADFGMILERKKELSMLCEPNSEVIWAQMFYEKNHNFRKAYTCNQNFLKDQARSQRKLVSIEVLITNDWLYLMVNC